MENPSVSLDQHPDATAFFDGQSNTLSHVIKDLASAVVIIAYITDNNLTLEWIIESHVHADHLSGAPYIQQKLGGKFGIGEHIMQVEETFGTIFNVGTEL